MSGRLTVYTLRVRTIWAVVSTSSDFAVALATFPWDDWLWGAKFCHGLSADFSFVLGTRSFVLVLPSLILLNLGHRKCELRNSAVDGSAW
jgi:hypothetical protein